MVVRLLMMVGSQMRRSGFWRVNLRRWRKGWRMDAQTGVYTAVKAARYRVGAIQVRDTN